MKRVIPFVIFALLPFLLVAKTHYLSVPDYKHAQSSYQLKGNFPELVVFSADKEIILRCDAKLNETNNCFDKALELSQQVGHSVAVYTLSLPYCTVCIEWNMRLEKALKESEDTKVSLYYVGE